MDMMAEEIKNALNDLALKGMDDWENHNAGQIISQHDLPFVPKRKASKRKAIQLTLFEK